MLRTHCMRAFQKCPQTDRQTDGQEDEWIDGQTGRQDSQTDP